MRQRFGIAHYSCAFILLICAGAGLRGQTPVYLHYDVSDGLPGNIVYCAAQDERGFMWFGTDKGLACFDGSRFRTFGVKDGLPDPEVLNLKLDSKERLWISSFRKKPCYRYKGKIYTEKEDKILNAVDFDYGIYQFYEQNAGNMWFSGGSKKVFLLKDTVFTEFIIPESAFFTANIDNEVYTLNKSYFYILNNQHVFEKIADIGFENPELAIKGVVKNGNRLLLSISNSLYIYEIKGRTVTKIQEKNNISGTLFLDHLKRYWVCSTKYGAVCFDNDREYLSNPVAFLEDKKITTMFEDHRHNLWFCTAGQGVYVLPESSSEIFTSKDGLKSNNITVVNEVADGKILAGDDQGTVYRVAKKISILADIGNGALNRSRQLLSDSLGNIYTVTDFGISRIDGKKIINIPDTRSAKCLLNTDAGWLIGTAANLKIATDTSGYAKILFPKRTTALLQDKEGMIWAGGIDGLFCAHDSFQLNAAVDFPLLKGRIIALSNSSGENFWAVTPEHGLLSVIADHGKVMQVRKINDSLEHPIENIQSIYEEKNKHLWLATNSGIYGLVNNQYAFHFDRYNGLPDNDVNSIVVQNDTIWAATVSGLAKIILNRKKQDDKFRTVITSLRYKIADKNFLIYVSDSFALEQKYTLPPEASLVELDLAGLEYSYRGNLQYRCIIKREVPSVLLWTTDNIVGWIKSGFRMIPDTTIISGNTLNFGVYLAPDRYLIEARAITPNGEISSMPAVWMLNKLPYWYQTFWFYLALWSITGYFIWRVVRTAIENRKLNTAVSELRLQAIQSQINPHFIGNSINAIQQFFFPPDPIRASDYISIFTRLLRTTMDFSEKPFVPLREEIAYDEDYLQMIHLRFGKRFHYSVNIGEGVDLMTPFPTMLLQPILENATIHGLLPEQTSILEISMTKDGKGLLICTVTDNGLGINYSKVHKNKREGHTSKGISLLEKKVSTLNDLYNIHCSMVISDLSDKNPDRHGTQVVLSYNAERILVTEHY